MWWAGGDVIVSVDGVRLTTRDSMESVVTRRKPGDVVPVGLWRGGRLMTLDVKLAAIR